MQNPYQFSCKDFVFFLRIVHNGTFHVESNGTFHVESYTKFLKYFNRLIEISIKDAFYTSYYTKNDVRIKIFVFNGINMYKTLSFILIFAGCTEPEVKKTKYNKKNHFMTQMKNRHKP